MITVFYAKANSINPSYTVLYEELSRRNEPDLRVFDISTLTIKKIDFLAKTSDLIVIDNFIYVANAINPKGFHSVMFEQWKGQNFYKEAFYCASNAGIPLLYISSGWDLHWPGPVLDQLLPSVTGIAWMFEQKPINRSEVNDAYRDSWMDTQVDPYENWNKVRNSVNVRIELTHSIGKTEFVKSNAKALWDVCIAGDTYRTRVIARQSANYLNLSEAPIRRIDPLINKTTAKLPPICGNRNASMIRNLLRQANQRFLTHRSKVNFVCGSGYCYPVRKFFEIPSVRSALIAFPFLGMSDYGFIDGKHFIEVAPEDFGSEAKKILSNENLRLEMIDNAWQLVMRLHSTDKRVDDLTKCMRLMAKGKLRLAKFYKGEFVIE